jgi:hypothetical protein
MSSRLRLIGAARLSTVLFASLYRRNGGFPLHLPQVNPMALAHFIFVEAS